MPSESLATLNLASQKSRKLGHLEKAFHILHDIKLIRELSPNVRNHLHDTIPSVNQ